MEQSASQQIVAKLNDLNFYSDKFLRIVTKKGDLSPLAFNSYQRELTRICQEDEASGKPVRVIVLKCRQIGGSTWGGAYNYHKTATRYYRKATVIAHDDDSTNNLFRMQKRFYDFSPKQIQPMKRYSNAKELVFENPDETDRGENSGLMSSITVENANNLTAGRGGTIHHLHCSEVAFWKNASTVIGGLFQAVPYEPGTSIIMESTANGIAGHGQEFYERCMAAMKGESVFRFIFFKWTHNPEYEIEPPLGFTMSEHERDLVKLHPELNLRKLAWRRYKIENEMGRTLMQPEDQFKQEYPLTPEEAFISSGRPVFNQERINADIERARSVRSRKADLSHGSWIDNQRGGYAVFNDSNGVKRYAIGADVAEGLETGDFSTMCIFDKNGEQVASYHGHIHPDLFGAEMIKAGLLYNKAILAPEVNNHGLTTLTHIMNKSYPFIYTRKILDERTNEYTSKEGWQTNVKTKHLMLDEFIAAYRDNFIKLNDIELLREMATLSLEPDGSVNLNGKDRVVAACIALQALKQLPSESAGAFDSSDRKPKFKGLEDMLRWSENNDSGESYFD